MSEKRYFSCPVAEIDFEDSSEHYTTDECGVYCCFWDCKTGLEECGLVKINGDIVEWIDNNDENMVV